jgi:hypothetical protein
VCFTPRQMIEVCGEGGVGERGRSGSLGGAEFWVRVVDTGGPSTIGLSEALSFDGVRKTVEEIGSQLSVAWDRVRSSSRLVSELGLTQRPPGQHSATLTAAGGGLGNTDVVPRIKSDPGNPRTEPVQTPAVSPPLPPRSSPGQDGRTLTTAKPGCPQSHALFINYDLWTGHSARSTDGAGAFGIVMVVCRGGWVSRPRSIAGSRMLEMLAPSEVQNALLEAICHASSHRARRRE